MRTAARVFKIKNLSDIDATLIEPASCAAHELDKIAPKMGSLVLLFGAGPTGLVSSSFFPSLVCMHERLLRQYRSSPNSSA